LLLFLFSRNGEKKAIGRKKKKKEVENLKWNELGILEWKQK